MATADPTGQDQRALRCLRQVELLTGAGVTWGNDAAVLCDGDATFAAILRAIAGAERFVALSAHVFWGGMAADVARALAGRARTGLPCFVLLDGLQTIKTDRAVLAHMRRAGVEVVRARLPWRHPLQLNRRVHRNVIVVDGGAAIVGGVGIADDWRTAPRRRPFRDRDLAIRGPVVADVLGSFAEEWLEATGELPAALRVSGDGERAPAGAGVPMLALRSRARTGTSPLERALWTLLKSARSRIDLSTAYLVPPRSIRTALAGAARRGVRVRLVAPGRHTNRSTSRRAAWGLYGELLRAGVEVYEYRPAMLHAKSLVIDGVLSGVGSANLDDRSLRLDDEPVVLVADRGLADRLTAEFEVDVTHSDRVDADRWRARPLRRRAAEGAALLVRRDL